MRAMKFSSVVLLTASIIVPGILRGGDGTLPLKLVGKVVNAADLGFSTGAYHIEISSYAETRDAGLVDLCGRALGDRLKGIDALKGKAQLAKAKFNLLAICHGKDDDRVTLWSKRLGATGSGLTKFSGEIDDDQNLIVGELEFLDD